VKGVKVSLVHIRAVSTAKVVNGRMEIQT